MKYFSRIKFLTERNRRKWRTLKYCFVIFLMVLVFLHLVALPAFSGGYNDECYLPDEKRRILRFMVEEISKAFDKFGVKYWLDYGTLLGAYRLGDILPYDHDADISFLVSSNISQAFRHLLNSGIQAAGIKARYKNVTVDFVPWRAEKTTNHGRKQVLLHKSYPLYVLQGDNFVTRFHHQWQSFPHAWVIPCGRMNFHSVHVAVPNSPERLLAHRYPWTFGMFRLVFPYKWKCWVPCSIRKVSGC